MCACNLALVGLYWTWVNILFKLDYFRHMDTWGTSSIKCKWHTGYISNDLQGFFVGETYARYVVVGLILWAWKALPWVSLGLFVRCQCDSTRRSSEVSSSFRSRLSISCVCLGLSLSGGSANVVCILEIYMECIKTHGRLAAFLIWTKGLFGNRYYVTCTSIF